MTIETATEQSTQDIAETIETKLYGTDEAEPEEIEGEVAQDDAEELPESDDTDTDEDEGSDSLDEISEFDEDQTIAALLGVEDDRIEIGDDGNVSLKAIIDGESKQVNLKDLVSSYQLQGHVNNQSIALANDRKEFDSAKAEITAQLKEQMEGISGMAEMMEKELIGEYNSIDWDELRTQNPSEWSALRQEYAEKAQKVRGAQSSISHKQQELNQQYQQEQIEEHQARLSVEMGKMIEDNPSWSDEAQRKTDQDGMRSFLTSKYGFSDEDMSAVTDHRLVRMIQDAKSFHEGSETAKSKQNKRLPKFRKSGANKANAASTAIARDAKAKRAKVKSSGSITDVANLLESRM